MATPDAPISNIDAVEEESDIHFTISGMEFFNQNAWFSLVVSFLFLGSFFLMTGPWPGLSEEEESPRVAELVVEPGAAAAAGGGDFLRTCRKCGAALAYLRKNGCANLIVSLDSIFIFFVIFLVFHPCMATGCFW